MDIRNNKEVKKEVITVIIPTYNGEKTLERAIKSILNQTEKHDIEIFVCDDCSTDRTLEIAYRLSCRVYINDYNTGGPETGRNAGILKSTGEFIAFLDQDDEWVSNKLELQFKEIRKGADIVYSQFIKKSDFTSKTGTENYPYLGSILARNKDIPLFNVHYNPYNNYIKKFFKDRVCKEVEPCVIRYENKTNLSFNSDFRKHDFYKQLMYHDNNLKVIKRLYGSRARYFYFINDTKKARFYFWRSNITWKTILYIVTSYFKFIRPLIIKHFNVYA